MHTQTQKTLADLTPQSALELLMDGNARFVSNLKAHRNLLEQVNETSDGQFPFAAILSCMDSRTSAELIFDQGLGDIFSIRVAGNILNPDILGCMEYACKIAGSKLVVVLGHTKCGAIQGACNGVKLGQLTGLLSKIQPAIDKESITLDNRDGSNESFVNNVTRINISETLSGIRQNSPILAELEKEGLIKIVPALYNVDNGQVEFWQE